MNSILSMEDFGAIAPLVTLLLGALLILLIETFYPQRSRVLSFWVALLTIGSAFLAVVLGEESDSALLIAWLRFDPLADILSMLFLLIGLGAILLSQSYFKRFEASQGEYYFLLLSALFGLILIGSAADFLTLFIGLETLSISLYILCGYMKKWEFSHESAVKYFLIGSIATAIFLFGIAMIYGVFGTTNFDRMSVAYLTISTYPDLTLFLTGISLVTLGLAFKAAIVPFHNWAPDVYAGAPTPVTAFMAVGTKAGAFAAFIRVFLEVFPQFYEIWSQGVSVLAYATLIYANFVAMRQTELRRFFAYSGIAHAGFLLLPIIAGTPVALMSIVFYLIVYALATLGAFAIIAFVDHRKEGILISDLQGLFHKSPTLSLMLTFCLLTLAGMPPTAGFFAKLIIFMVAFQAGYYGLVIVALLTTVLAAYYYLRIAAVMFYSPTEETPAVQPSWSAAILGATTFAALIFLSIYPEPLVLLLTEI